MEQQRCSTAPTHEKNASIALLPPVGSPPEAHGAGQRTCGGKSTPQATLHSQQPASETPDCEHTPALWCCPTLPFVPLPLSFSPPPTHSCCPCPTQVQGDLKTRLRGLCRRAAAQGCLRARPATTARTQGAAQYNCMHGRGVHSQRHMHARAYPGTRGGAVQRGTGPQARAPPVSFGWR